MARERRVRRKLTSPDVLYRAPGLVSIALMRCFLALLLALLAPPLLALPETPLFHGFGPEQGLPSSKVAALAQDRDGYLWIGTNDGLARFDGEDFAIWQHAPERHGSLPSNAIQALLVDSGNRLWVGTAGGGLALLDAERETFERPSFDAQPGGGVRDVWAIAETPDGAIWYGGFDSGLFRLQPDSGEIRRFLADASRSGALPGNDVLSLAVDAAGALWVGTTEGLARWDGFDFVIQPELDRRLIVRLRGTPDGGLLIGTGTGPNLRSADGQLSTPRLDNGDLPALPVTSMQHDAGGALWFGTAHGLYLVDDAALQRYRADRRRPFTLGAHAVMDLLLDHEGGLWIATEGGGLAHLPRDWRAFSIWVFAWDQPDSPSMLMARGLAQGADGKLWLIGSGGGLDRLDPQTGRFERFLDGDSKLPERRGWSVLETADKAVWIGHQRGLSRFDPGSGDLRHWWSDPSDPSAPMAGAVDLLLDDGEGGFWASVLGAGIERRNAQGELLERIAEGPASGLPAGNVEQMLLGPDSALWVASARGVLRWNGERFERPLGLPDAPATALGFDRGGRLWVHQRDALQAFDWSQGEASPQLRFDGGDGLPAVQAGGLMPDHAGRIWLTTQRGLVRVEPDSGDIRLFGLRDGLPSIEFSDRPGLLTREGLIVTGAMGALVAFDPASLDTEVDLPWLRIERVALRREGERVELDPGQPLRLRHDDRELTVAARAMSFADPDRLRYRFRLDGYDDDWIEQRGRGDRVFGQLPAGSYTLNLQASDRLGRWRGDPMRLSVVVAPSWWQRAESIAGFLLLALLLGWLALQAWKRRLQQRHAVALGEQERHLALRASQAKTEFLQHLGHEVRTPMTGVLGMTELLQGTSLQPAQQRYVDAIARSGDLMLRVVNDALDLARIEAGRMTLSEQVFSPAQLLREVAEPLRALARRKQLDFDLELAEQAPAQLRGDPLRVRQILLNLGNNAVKFTEAGKVVLQLLPAQADATLVVQVCDTGPGLSAGQQARLFHRFVQADDVQTAHRYGGSGLGLALCRQLAELMGGRIELDSAPGQGSRFRLLLALPPGEPAAAPPDIVPLRCEKTLDVLLVEDDATVAAVICGLLEQHGHRVRHAAHGLAALTELQRAPADLALLDLDLPGMDGLQLAALLRQRGERLPLLAITARADAEAEVAATAAGMNGFLRKPISGAQLQTAIAKYTGAGRDLLKGTIANHSH